MLRAHVARWLVSLTLVMGLAGGGALSLSQLGCGTSDAPHAPVDTHAAYLETARSGHVAADQAELSGDPARAIKLLEGVLESAPKNSNDERVRAVVSDTAARLAELRIASEHFEEAQRDIELGLAVTPSGSLLAGRLVELQGVLSAREASSRADGGGVDERAQKRAIAELERAVGIYEGIIKNAERAARSVVDDQLVAMLGRASALNHLADVHMAMGNRRAAMATIERVAGSRDEQAADFPPEVRELRADAFATLAELRSADSDFEGANAAIDAGLGFAVERTLFRGRLMEVLGTVEERKSKSLRAAGDETAADVAKERAIGAFEQAVSIQEQVIMKALGR